MSTLGNRSSLLLNSGSQCRTHTSQLSCECIMLLSSSGWLAVVGTQQLQLVRESPKQEMQVLAIDTRTGVQYSGKIQGTNRVCHTNKWTNEPNLVSWLQFRSGPHDCRLRSQFKTAHQSNSPLTNSRWNYKIRMPLYWFKLKSTHHRDWNAGKNWYACDQSIFSL